MTKRWLVSVVAVCMLALLSSTSTEKDSDAHHADAATLGVNELGKSSDAKFPIATTTASQELEYPQDVVPESRAQDGFDGITNLRLALYYEIPVSVMALIIGIGARIARRHKVPPLRRSSRSR